MEAESLLARLATPPIFVLGGARTGANWVFEFLSAHPEVARARETGAFAVARGAPGELREHSARVLGAVVGPEHRFVVERTATHVFAAQRIAAAWPEALLIHVLRDGRDVAVRAWLRQADWSKEWQQRFGSGFIGAARAWADAVREVRGAGVLAGERFREVRFEDVNHDRRAAGARLLRFCGIPHDDAILDDILASGDGWLNRPTNLDAWKDYLSIYRAFLMERAIGDTLRTTGYESERTWWWRPLRRT